MSVSEAGSVDVKQTSGSAQATRHQPSKSVTGGICARAQDKMMGRGDNECGTCIVRGRRPIENSQKRGKVQRAKHFKDANGCVNIVDASQDTFGWSGWWH